MCVQDPRRRPTAAEAYSFAQMAVEALGDKAPSLKSVQNHELSTVFIQNHELSIMGGRMLIVRTLVLWESEC